MSAEDAANELRRINNERRGRYCQMCANWRVATRRMQRGGTELLTVCALTSMVVKYGATCPDWSRNVLDR
jgi:hypothetical protein